MEVFGFQGDGPIYRGSWRGHPTGGRGARDGGRGAQADGEIATRSAMSAVAGRGAGAAMELEEAIEGRGHC